LRYDKNVSKISGPDPPVAIFCSILFQLDDIFKGG